MLLIITWWKRQMAGHWSCWIKLKVVANNPEIMQEKRGKPGLNFGGEQKVRKREWGAIHAFQKLRLIHSSPLERPDGPGRKTWGKSVVLTQMLQVCSASVNQRGGVYSILRRGSVSSWRPNLVSCLPPGRTAWMHQCRSRSRTAALGQCWTRSSATSCSVALRVQL